MGAPTGVDAEAMRLQNEEFKKENDDLRSKLQSLTEKVQTVDVIGGMDGDASCRRVQQTQAGLF